MVGTEDREAVSRSEAPEATEQDRSLLGANLQRRRQRENFFERRQEPPWKQGSVVQGKWKGKGKCHFENTEGNRRARRSRCALCKERETLPLSEAACSLHLLRPMETEIASFQAQI